VVGRARRLYGPEDGLCSIAVSCSRKRGPPMVPGNYNNNIRLCDCVSSDSVEMPHQTRIVPLGKRASFPRRRHSGRAIRRATGRVIRLVVETSNVRFNNQSHFGTQYNGMSDENLRSRERFARTGPETLIYRATVSDLPSIPSRGPSSFRWKRRTSDLRVRVCHEAITALAGFLSGARAQEKKGGGEGRSGRYGVGLGIRRPRFLWAGLSVGASALAFSPSGSG